MNDQPNKQPDPRDSKVLNKLAKLIDVRLPDQHGFALLTFPLGPAVDARVRYIGKGNRQDILVAMQAWIDVQRGGVWGHDMAPPETQWTTQRPTKAGIYILRDAASTIDDDLDIVRVDDARFLWERSGEQWDQGFDRVDDLQQTRYLWLGPLPLPWASVQPVLEDDRSDVRPPGVKCVRDDDARPGDTVTIADNRPEDFFWNEIDRHHGEAIDESATRLLDGIPAGGGSFNREVLDRLIRQAFRSGVAAQVINPMTEKP